MHITFESNMLYYFVKFKTSNYNYIYTLKKIFILKIEYFI